MFSKYKTIEKTSFFELQERKKESKFKVMRKKKYLRRNFRILARSKVQGRPPLKIAYSHDLQEIKNTEWAFCSKTFEEQIVPTRLSPEDRYRWIEAYFTNIAIEQGIEVGDDVTKDDKKEKVYLEYKEESSKSGKSPRSVRMMGFFFKKDNKHKSEQQKSRSISPASRQLLSPRSEDMKSQGIESNMAKAEKPRRRVRHRRNSTGDLKREE
eukprot:CAMPEP_0167766486 /NCGR_PEP_ID=MMETSP0110_2-20121227/15379_1 /TAXON_ID=629695 /ORGANISM="Gymnochlora sp., Strain CCMP2014" /LENGTH=210 /DNA_ID=CAMNT_0007654535 /DNA_START=57 /DNA_END=689 /DNA_ORIENTATION=+